MFSRKVAAVTDKTILYDLPGIGCKATARRVKCQRRFAKPDTALLIQVLIAKTSNAGIGIDVEPQDALYDGLVSYCRNLTGKQSRMISLAEMEPTALAALEVQHSAPFDIECETPLLLAAAESQYSGVTRKGVHALALQVSGIPLTAVATRMSAPPNHVSAWISRAVHKLRNDESFLSSLHEN